MTLIKNIFLLILFVIITLKGTIASNRTIDYHNIIFEHITPDDGLPYPTINDILQDEQGFMWFATENGLCRYDAYNYKIYQHDPLDTNSLPNNNVLCLLEDRNNNLWIGTSYGLCVLDKYTGEITRFFNESENHQSLWDNSVNDLIQDRKGNIWIGTSKGLNIYNENRGTIERYNFDINILKGKGQNISCKILYKDYENNIWIGTWGHGLIRLNIDEKIIKQYFLAKKAHQKPVSFIEQDRDGNLHVGYKNQHVLFSIKTGEIIDTLMKFQGAIRSAMIDDNKNVWIGGDKELLIYTGKPFHTPIRYVPDDDNPYSISEGNINKIYRDHAGNIWISSTGKGVDVYYKYENNFNQYYYPIKSPVHRDYGKELFIDSRGYLWYGTFGDGLLLFDKELRFINRFYHNDLNNKSSLAGNYIWCIKEDRQKHIWIGTDNGISVYNPYTKEFIKTIRKNDKKENTITHDLILDILFDNDGNIWIATQEGLDIITPGTDSVIHITEEDGICHYKVIEMIKDRSGKIWLGTYNGLSCYDPDKHKFKNYIYNPKNNGELSNQLINAIYQDSAGFIWAGTDNGLNKLNPSTDKVEYIFEKDGLINNHVNNIFGDNMGNLWINTPLGISKINVKEGMIVNYGRDDGLKINHTGMYMQDDNLYLAGENTGFYKFSIHEIKSNPLVPPVYITEIRVNGTRFKKNYSTILSNGQQKEEKIRFTHNQSSLEFNFTALNFVSSNKNQYKYILEGFDGRWIESPAQQRYAVYNNLLPGEYIFKVKGSNNNAVWNEEEASFQFTILPPWWKTWWAYLLYVIIFISFVYLFVYIRKNSMQLKIQKEKARMQHEMDEMKLNFFTDISHELRTPLSLIKGVVDRLFNIEIKHITKDNVKKYSGLLKRNSERLLMLIDQIMDIRKLDKGNISLTVQKMEIVQFIKNIAVDFQETAQAQGIRFTFDNVFSALEGWIDKDKMEKIIYNLLSNALKYTTSKGTIHMKIKKPDLLLHGDENKDDFISIYVFNSGEPIPENELSRIFERYHRLPDVKYTNQQGTGIGLSLVKKLTEIHKGKIHVKSIPGEGNTFEIIIPVSKHFYDEKEIEKRPGKPFLSGNDISFKLSENKTKESFETFTRQNKGGKDFPELLIVEDNQDVRDFIKMLFNEKFNIYEASNGKEGLEIARDIIPDIIIADIVMPEMDGIELSRLIKDDINTSHVPLIMLTARTRTESQIKGFRAGADAYITKPFDEQILQTRVYQLLESREKLREKYGKNFAVLPEKSNKKLESADDNFLEQVIFNIDDNISNARLSPDFLVEKSGMCKTNFYKKFKSLTNYPVNKFIMIYRLKKAAQLIQESDLSISEISYLVGFTYISHFTRNFKEHFGSSPSEFKNKNNDKSI